MTVFPERTLIVHSVTWPYKISPLDTPDQPLRRSKEQIDSIYTFELFWGGKLTSTMMLMISPNIPEQNGGVGR